MTSHSPHKKFAVNRSKSFFGAVKVTLHPKNFRLVDGLSLWGWGGEPEPTVNCREVIPEDIHEMEEFNGDLYGIGNGEWGELEYLPYQSL
eukprot:CAMPEP_0194596106 /NCGR_PEP_ID=MMETSP0292-20121207/25438_1 /TAXON_ID=39354 /ORGANISM="Heterosigma akashiwo, Strain CCMP2393" /LENGTH=89 /DNA_ID=CAMNT_0039456257 /DNA_START=67 /DNA_END=333 /DNA_ORIENTATION=+